MDPCTARDVVAALERRFNPEGKVRQYATFTEVPNKSERRRIDFMAVNLWIGRGREVHGVEIKVNRRDWQTELKSPKADEWFVICDRWWLAAPQGVVQPDELPKPWGFLEVRRNGDSWKLFEKVKAPDLEPIDTWPPWLVSRLLRRVDDRRRAEPAELEAMRTRHRDEVDATFEQGRARGLADAEVGVEARRLLDELLQALGISTYGWRKHPERVEQVRRAIEMLDNGDLFRNSRVLERRLRSAADSILAMLPEEDDETEKHDVF